MKGNQKKVYSLGDFQMKFIPISLTFQRSSTNPFKLYIMKNVQVIGQIKERVEINSKALKFTFSSSIQPIQFRVLSHKHTTYQLSIYEIGPNGVEEWKAEAQINLAKFLTHFEQQFKKQDQNLHAELRQKEASLPQIWKEICRNFNQKEWISTAKFKSIDAVLEFKIIPYHQYDQMVRIYEIEKEKQDKERKAKALFRSSTQPNLVRNFTMPNISKTSAQEEPTPSKKLSASATLTQEIHTINRQMQKINNQLQLKTKQKHLSNIQQQQESVLGKNSKVQGQKTDEMVTSGVQVDIDNELQEQELRAIQKTIEKDQPRVRYLARQEAQRSRKMPDSLGITDVRSNSQINRDNSQPSRLGIISIGSGSDKPNLVVSSGSGIQSKLKQYVLTGLAVVVLGFLVIFLMNPISKVY